jgi:bifunctional non-homologous end joining protein LigD
MKTFSPMLATIGTELPRGDDWVYEPKYDGIRILASVDTRRIALVSRNGIDKARQFPEVVDALRILRERAGRSFVVDGEIVATHKDAPARFQALQSRMHVTNGSAIEHLRTASPVAMMTFDLLLDGRRILLGEPWRERRKALAALFEWAKGLHAVRLGDVSSDGPAMLRKARRNGWEGVIAKRASATYDAGHRSRAWLKLKIERRQEFVVGGWTEPRKSREHIGAILLGYYDDEGAFVYAGHTGTGFTRASLADMYTRLKRIERKTPPFVETPRTNEKAHWTRPAVVVEIKFNEWTSDGRLRQPVFIGVRTDKPAREVVREPDGRVA